jgi:hypothetical protein
MRRDFPHPTASVFSFTRKDQDEGSPGRITDAFSEMMILNQSRYVQIFNCDFIKLSDELKAQFVKEIYALAFDLQVLLCEQAGCFLSALRLSLPPRKSALRCLQPLLCLTKILGILDYLASRKSCVVFNAYINSNRFACPWNEGQVRFFNRKDSIPAIYLAFDRTGFNFAFNRTVLNDFYFADFREAKPPAFDPESTLHLRKRERVVTVLRFEARVTWRLTFRTATEERIEGYAQSSQNVLQDLSADLPDVFAQNLDLRKLHRLDVIVDRSAGDLISISTLLQTSIVKLSAYIKPLLKVGFLSLRRLEFELVCLHHYLHFTQKLIA